MASNPAYSDITPEIEMLADLALSNSTIDPNDFGRYNVKRGLRDLSRTDRNCRCPCIRNAARWHHGTL